MSSYTHKNAELHILGLVRTDTSVSLPLYMSSISAGFPSPADDYHEKGIDLNTHLIQNPSATFLVRVQGDSMIGVGIFPQDVLIVDKSLSPKHGDVVVAIVDGNFTVKTFHHTKEGVYLYPANKKYKPFRITEQLEIWGVVTYVIHKPA